MRILIIQHEQETPAGTTLDWLKLHGVDFEILLAPQISHYPSPSGYDGVIILGGSMNVDEETNHPWLVAEKNFIRNCLDQKTKTLGLCLGSQLLAEALGAQVQSMNQWEIGWFDIETYEGSIPAFHWHQYNFSIPTNAQRNASSEACANQGFTLGTHVLAFQFHPEVDAAWIDLSLKDWKTGLKGATQSKEEILMDNQTKLSATKAWYFRQLQNFFITTSS